jgi:hypothetical protein
MARIKTFKVKENNRGGVVIMSKVKKDPSTIGLNSPQVEGQGTTENEMTGTQKDSARRKTKRH